MRGEPPLFWLFLFFPFFWVGVSFMLARFAGWSRLADRFTAKAPPTGKKFWIESGKFGWVSYNSCLTIHVGPEGLHVAVWPPFRFGHPPLLIPWRELRKVGSRKIFFLGEQLKFEAGSPPIATVELSHKLFVHHPAAA